jgi:hypothetical protein
MGAGILPTTIHNGTLYFLFGKENKFADTPGWSDFGGGTDTNETYLQTAIREGGEELTGFLGSDADLSKLLKKGTFNIDNGDTYRMHIFYMKYDPQLPHYYNNNQQFLQKKLDPKVIEKSKIFEKEEIQWISVNEMMKMRSKFRSYFQEIVDKIYKNKNEIIIFINKKSYLRKTQKKRNH